MSLDTDELPKIGGEAEGERADRDKFEKRMRLNMGPQHPSTHGVLQVVLDLEGEVVVRCDPVPGYLHRGTEKLAEHKNYTQIIPLTDRLDYIAAFTSNVSYCMAVEKLLGLEIPPRAQWLRLIFSELQRIASHLLGIGTHVMDIGAITVFLYTMRDREMILDLFEMGCGARLTYSFGRIGGIIADVPAGFFEALREFVKVFPARHAEYMRLIAKNPIFMDRTIDVAVFSPKDAIAMSATGPMLRGSGIPADLRKDEPYLNYDQLDFDVPVGTKGDSYDRFLIRMEEMIQSVRIIEQAMKRVPEGPVKADDPKVVLPPKELAMTTAEAMQRHFVQVIHGFPTPVGEIYSEIESPKGRLGFYIVSDGSARPYRLKIRAPSYINLSALPLLCEGRMVADVVTAIGTLDIVLGEVDR